jgi:PIN domain nuclease of toxin-antitoxin system
MHLLVDTHVLIWVSENDPQLSNTAKLALESPTNSKYVSIATFWEMAIKINIGKLRLSKPLATIISDVLSNEDITLLPIEPKHVLFIESMTLYHRDPFDRVLIAQAICEDFILVSNEVLFDQYGLKRLW